MASGSFWQGICFEKASGEVAPLDDAAVRAQAALKALKEKAAGKGGFAKNTSERLLLPDYRIHAVCRHHIRKCSSSRNPSLRRPCCADVTGKKK